VTAFRLTEQGYTDLGLRYWLRADAGPYDARARALADRHYSRRQPGAAQCVGPGRGRIVLVTRDGGAAWAWLRPLSPMDGRDSWRCTLFRREAGPLASDLVLDAERALSAIGVEPTLEVLTYVRPDKVRSPNPGYCFLIAGWRRDGLSAQRAGHARLLRLVKPWSRLGCLA
jgi:hypothetical protein